MEIHNLEMETSESHGTFKIPKLKKVNKFKAMEGELSTLFYSYTTPSLALLELVRHPPSPLLCSADLPQQVLQDYFQQSPQLLSWVPQSCQQLLEQNQKHLQPA